MKKVFAIFFVFMCGIRVFAQIVTVKDQEDQHPLEMVTITSVAQQLKELTDVAGQVDISTFKNATDIEFRILGYKRKVLTYSELEKANFKIFMVSSAVSLDQVVVSATRRYQSMRQVPSRVISISSKDVTLQNPQTVADLLAASGQVFVQKSQSGGGSPMIRGFATNRLLIAVDGVRMNNAIFRSGNLQNVISLDAFAIGSTEVLFGPGSVIYGSDAIAGVMSFQTLKPHLSSNNETFISGKAVVRYSSANSENTYHFDINTGWQKWAAISSFTYSDFGDLRMGAYGRDEYLQPFYVERQNDTDVIIENRNPLLQKPTGYAQTNLMQKISYKPNDQWALNYGIHYSTTTDYSRYDRLIRYKNGKPRSAEWYYGPQIWLMNSLDISHTTKNFMYDVLTIKPAYQHFEESRIDRDINDNERRKRYEEVDAYSLNLDFTKSISARFSLNYGFETVLNIVNSTGMNEDISTMKIATAPARYPQSNWKSYAAYLTSQWNISEKLLVQSGLRYNQFMLNSTFDTTFYSIPFTKANINNAALTGSMGLMYYPAKSTIISFNLSTGFRSPNVDDIGKVFDSEPGAVVVPNTNLSAEYIYNAEAGISKVLDDVVKINLNCFYSVLQNAMVRRNFVFNGQDSIFYNGEMSQVQAIQNAAKAYVYGVQASVEMKLTNGLGLSAHYNFQKGEEELDNGTTSPLRHAAPWFAVSHLTYSINKLKLDFYGMYNAEVGYENLANEERGKAYLYAVDNNGNPYSPAWFTLNFKLFYRLSYDLSISGGVENITDRRYRSYSSGITAAGRNVILSVVAKF